MIVDDYDRAAPRGMGAYKVMSGRAEHKGALGRS